MNATVNYGTDKRSVSVEKHILLSNAIIATGAVLRWAGKLTVVKSDG